MKRNLMGQRLKDSRNTAGVSPMIFSPTEKMLSIAKKILSKANKSFSALENMLFDRKYHGVVDRKH